MSVVSLEYRCYACRESFWGESDLVPLKRFMPHYCPDLEWNTVIPAVVPDDVEQLVRNAIKHKDDK